MFIKEMASLTGTRADWDISSYRDLLINFGGIEKKTAFISHELEELEKDAKRISALLEKKEYKLNVINGDNLTSLFGKIDNFLKKYEEINKLKKNNENIFTDNPNFGTSFDYLTRCSKVFAPIANAAPVFKKALAFYQKFIKLGEFNEKEIRKFDKLVNSDYKVAYNEYLPDDCLSIIRNIPKLLSNVNKAEEFLSNVEEYIQKYDFCRHTTDNLSRPVHVWESIVENGNQLLTEYENLCKNNKTETLAAFETNQKSQIKAIINAATSLCDKTTSKGRSFEIIASILTKVWLILVGSLAVYTIIEDIVQRFQNGNWFLFAIIFGIIVGILKAAIRVLAACSLGIFWWPNSFDSLEFFDNCGLLINITIMVLGLAVVLISRKRNMYALSNGKNEFDESMVSASIMCFSVALFLVRVILTTVVYTINSWHWLLFLFAIVWGLVVGVLQCVLLVVGAGYWWESLYASLEMNHSTLNTVFYVILVIFIVVFACYADVDTES